MFLIKQVPRSENKKADTLNKITSTSFAHLSKQVLVEELKEKSINELIVLAMVEDEGDTWMTLIYEHLIEETPPAEVNKVRAVRRKSQRFAMINGVLYKKSFLGPWLRCVGPLQANYVIREIHERSCSMYAGTRSIVLKALQTIYYWPPMYKDVRTLIRACQNYQGIDIAGPFPEGPERVNRSLGEGIKASLDARSKNWIKEVSHVLWTHRTMIKSSNEDTLFSLTYGMEAVIPAKIGMPTLRIMEVDMVQNDEPLEINLDLLEERKEQASIREAKRKVKMKRYYNSKVRNTSFKPGDLVYHSNDASHAE
uniref:Reverse transcriptase domain-containing protein n=1 Tax=Tanacetum cinerariifolium TaxID=118510 RepID=A0A6L2LEZ5_TANCI|nr:reverse transcriptase domain-containing protein [Tanacetum cinerariifolium]